ncbi:uncharacterized protein TNCV_4190751, partial [Trichonephila clavipes]
ASSHLETDGKVINRPTKRKLPRSLLGILENDLDYHDYVTPKRKTKVSQEVWASSLALPAQYSRKSGQRKTLLDNKLNGACVLSQPIDVII